MGEYHQYCPIARTSEVLAERWTPLIVRNLLFGAETFSSISRGVPQMSRSMLLKRLGQLERAGILERAPKEVGRGHLYHLTPAGKDLAGVILAMGVWGERWVEVTTEHSDPGFALWAWAQVQVDRSRLPEQRTVIAFTFPEEVPGNRHYWLLVEDGEVEVCYSDPGGEPDLWVTAASLPFVNWHRGRLPWSRALRDGSITTSGPRRLARALPTWNLHQPVLPVS